MFARKSMQEVGRFLVNSPRSVIDHRVKILRHNNYCLRARQQSIEKIKMCVKAQRGINTPSPPKKINAPTFGIYWATVKKY